MLPNSNPHDLGYDLAVVGLRIVDGGVNDYIDGPRCLLLGACDALDHDLSELGDLLAQLLPINPDGRALAPTRPTPHERRG